MSRKKRKRGGKRKMRDAQRVSSVDHSNTKKKDQPLPSHSKSQTTEVMPQDFSVRSEVLKVDEGLGLVLGWAIVSKENGEPYFDLQGDHIPEQSMLEAAADFMMNSRVASHMHKGEVQSRGTVVFAFPMTEEIAKAFGIETKKTGLMIAMKPDSEMLEKFRTGELTGFSIGGSRGDDEEVS